MRRRAIAILALALTGGVTVSAQQQAAPVIDGRNGSVTISPQTLEWFRQRLAEEEERLRQLQITVNQIARALPALQAQATPLTPAPSAPTAANPAPIGGPATGTGVPATVGSPAAGTGTPTRVGSPIATGPSTGPVPVPGAATVTPAPAATRRAPRIAIPTFAPNRGGVASGVTTEVDVNGSPVPIVPEDDLSSALPGGGAQAGESTAPSVMPLAAPLRAGLTPGEVRQLKGAPAFIQRDDTEGDETWNYPDGSVTFRAGRLVEWGNRTARAPALERLARRSAPTAAPATASAAGRGTTVVHPRPGGTSVPGTSKGPNVALADADVEVPVGVIAEPLGETAEPSAATTELKGEPQEKKKPVVTRSRPKKKIVRCHHRSRQARWRSHRSRRWAWRQHRRYHRLALRTHGPRSRRITRAQSSCELCRMARAHLRTQHPIIQSKVAAWRTGFMSRTSPPSRPATTARKRSSMRL